MFLLLTLLAQPYQHGPAPSELGETFERVCGSAKHPAVHFESDLNFDGHRDNAVSNHRGGVDWGETCRCQQDGASGQQSCGTWTETPTSFFSSWLPSPFPHVPPDFQGGQAGPGNCQAPDRDNPAQALMWLLETPHPDFPPQQEAIAWVDGPALEQARVCLSPEQARAFRGGLAWDPAELHKDSARVVVYTPSSEGYFQRPQAPLVTSPSGGVQAELHGHGVLLYQAKADRHAWVLNGQAWVPEHFKVRDTASVSQLWFWGDTLHIRIQADESTEFSIPWTGP